MPDHGCQVIFTPKTSVSGQTITYTFSSDLSGNGISRPGDPKLYYGLRFMPYNNSLPNVKRISLNMEFEERDVPAESDPSVAALKSRYHYVIAIRNAWMGSGDTPEMRCHGALNDHYTVPYARNAFTIRSRHWLRLELSAEHDCEFVFVWLAPRELLTESVTVTLYRSVSDTSEGHVCAKSGVDMSTTNSRLVELPCRTWNRWLHLRFAEDMELEVLEVVVCANSAAVYYVKVAGVALTVASLLLIAFRYGKTNRVKSESPIIMCVPASSRQLRSQQLLPSRNSSSTPPTDENDYMPRERKLSKKQSKKQRSEFVGSGKLSRKTKVDNEITFMDHFNTLF